MKQFTKHIIAVAIMLPVAAHAGSLLKKLTNPVSVAKATLPPVEKVLIEQTHQNAQNAFNTLQKSPSELLNPKNALALDPAYQGVKLATQAPVLSVQAQIRQQQELWGSEPGVNNTVAASGSGSVFSNTMRAAIQQANAAQQQPYGPYQGQAQLNMTNQAASQAQQMRQQADLYLDDYRRMVREDSATVPAHITGSVLDRATTVTVGDKQVHYIAPQNQILGTPSAMPIYANGQTLVTSNTPSNLVESNNASYKQQLLAEFRAITGSDPVRTDNWRELMPSGLNDRQRAVVETLTNPAMAGVWATLAAPSNTGLNDTPGQGRISMQQDAGVVNPDAYRFTDTRAVNPMEVGFVGNATRPAMDGAMNMFVGSDWYQKTAKAIGGNSSDPWNEQISIWRTQYDQLNRQDLAQVEQWREGVAAVIEGRRAPDVRPRDADGTLWRQQSNAVASDLSNALTLKPLIEAQRAAVLQEQAAQEAARAPVVYTGPTQPWWQNVNGLKASTGYQAPVEAVVEQRTTNPTPAPTVVQPRSTNPTPVTAVMQERSLVPTVRAPSVGRGSGLTKEAEVDLRRFTEDKKGAASWVE